MKFVGATIKRMFENLNFHFKDAIQLSGLMKASGMQSNGALQVQKQGNKVKYPYRYFFKKLEPCHVFLRATSFSELLTLLLLMVAADGCPPCHFQGKKKDVQVPLSISPHSASSFLLVHQISQLYFEERVREAKALLEEFRQNEEHVQTILGLPEYCSSKLQSMDRSILKWSAL